jgi:hypothetical protein
MDQKAEVSEFVHAIRSNRSCACELQFAESGRPHNAKQSPALTLFSRLNFPLVGEPIRNGANCVYWDRCLDFHFTLRVFWLFQSRIKGEVSANPSQLALFDWQMA